MLLIICVERSLHISSHFSQRKWRRQPHFPTKLAAVASFSYKIGGGDLATLLAAVLTWSGYWHAASKSEHCSDSTLLNRNLFGIHEGTQVNSNIVRIASLPIRNLFSLHEGTQVNPNIV